MGTSERHVPTIAYTVDEFGGPENVTIDGNPIPQIQRMEVSHDVEEFCIVTLKLIGYRVISKPSKEPAIKQRRESQP